MCWGLNPSGPPAEPAGKERIASRTTSSDTCNGSTAGCGGSGRPALFPTGCFSLNFVAFSSENGASWSSDPKMLMAARKFPSSILEETMAASEASGSRRPPRAETGGGSLTLPLHLEITTFAMLGRFPSWWFNQGMLAPKIKRRAQCSTLSASVQISHEIEPSFTQHADLAALETCFNKALGNWGWSSLPCLHQIQE